MAGALTLAIDTGGAVGLAGSTSTTWCPWTAVSWPLTTTFPVTGSTPMCCPTPTKADSSKGSGISTVTVPSTVDQPTTTGFFVVMLKTTLYRTPFAASIADSCCASSTLSRPLPSGVRRAVFASMDSMFDSAAPVSSPAHTPYSVSSTAPTDDASNNAQHSAFFIWVRASNKLRWKMYNVD